jgi:hypothetical protein
MMDVPQSSRQISPEEQAFYSFISHDPVLSHFLATGNLQSNAKFTANKIYKDPRFLRFISPVFEDAFTSAVIQCLRTGNTSMMGDIMANPILLDDDYKERSYCSILIFLQAKQQKLISIWNNLQLKHKVKPSDMEQQTSITTINLLNYLPDEFQGLRSEYCNELVKITRLLAKTDYHGASELIMNARQMNCLPQSQQRAEDCYRELLNMEANEKHERPAFVLFRYILAFSKK